MLYEVITMDFLLNGMAYVYYKKREFEKAIKYANRTLNEYPEFFWAYLTLAEIYGEMDQLDKFARSLDPAVNQVRNNFV